MADDVQQNLVSSDDASNSSGGSVPGTTGSSVANPLDENSGSSGKAGDPASGASQQNPLDVLEKLLDEIDSGKGSGSQSKGVAGGAQAPAGPTPEEIAAKEAEEELERRRIEYEEKQAQQQVIDQQKIEEQRQALVEEMQHGTANVAREQQDKEKAEKQEEAKQAGEGFEVVQLGHTKI